MPTIATLIFSQGEKVVVLTIWLVWLIAVMMFLIVIEHVRDSLERQMALGDMSDDDLRELFSARDSLENAPVPKIEGLQRWRDK